MYEYLKLNDKARDEIKKIDQYNFNIFTLREHTNENELVSVLMVTLAKRGALGGIENLKSDALVQFMAVI